jgi:hypothetical protein
LFSKTLSLRSSLKVRDQVSRVFLPKNESVCLSLCWLTLLSEIHQFRLCQTFRPL